MKKAASLSVALLCGVGLCCLLAGCGSQEPAGSESGALQPAAVESTGESGPAEKQLHSGATERAAMHEEGSGKESDKAAEIAAALEKLAAEDRAAAEKQKVCPVSGQPLGSMGTPVKVTVKGQTLFLCCPGCKPAIEKDPDKYLAKLGK